MCSVKLHYIRQFHRSKELAPIRIHKNTRATSVTLVFLVRRKGFGVCCGCALHTDGSPTEMRGISVPGSPLFAENSPPGCFLNAKTLTGSNPYNPINKNTEVTKVTSVFLVRRKGFSAAAAAIASLRSLPTAAKTAHRAVFFRMLRILPPCSNPFLCAVIIKSLRQHKFPEVFGTPEGIRTPDLLVRSNVDSH